MFFEEDAGRSYSEDDVESVDGSVSDSGIVVGAEVSVDVDEFGPEGVDFWVVEFLEDGD